VGLGGESPKGVVREDGESMENLHLGSIHSKKWFYQKDEDRGRGKH